MTESCAEVVPLYLFWKRKRMAGLVVLLMPPIIASTLIFKFVDLEAYKQSAFVSYIRAYMTPMVVAVRLLGTVITHLGAWYRKPALIPLGLMIVLLAWLRGILWRYLSFQATAFIAVDTVHRYCVCWVNTNYCFVKAYGSLSVSTTSCRTTDLPQAY